MRFIIFCFLLIPGLIISQQITPTKLKTNSEINSNSCQTPAPNYEEAILRMKRLKPFIEQNRNMASSITVRLVVHRLSSSTGIEGPSIATIEAAVDKVRVEYAAADICFSLEGINYINDDVVLTATPSDYDSLVYYNFYPNHGDPDRIDAFIYPSEVNIAGVAGGIPSDYFSMGEQRLLGWITFSHEMGHCFGLIHTHEIYGQSCPGTKIEYIDGSNCSTAGDLICDTPADPNLSIFTTNNVDTTNCIFIGTSLTDCNGDTPYTPLVNNMMSYAGPCRTVFTSDQNDRMRAELLGGTVGPILSTLAPLTLGINSGSVTGGQHHRTAKETIITAVGATITISNGAKVFHGAGQKIILGPGFEAKPGNGRYTGRVGEPCN